MEIKKHTVNNKNIAEVISETIVIQNLEDGLDLMGNLYYQGYDAIVLQEKQLNPDFFDLKTKFAGELLQKFTNYRMHLSIIGDFSKYKSKSLKAFITESNRGKQIYFVSSLNDAFQTFKP